MSVCGCLPVSSAAAQNSPPQAVISVLMSLSGFHVEQCQPGCV